MDLSFTDLRYFVEVAQSKNITRAAERLGIAQPSLSAAMNRLEDTVGCNLLIRSRSGVNLSRAGNELLVKSHQILEDWRQIRSNINRRKLEVSGFYKIGCHPSVGLYSLSSFLPKLMASHPNLHIELEHDLSRHITEKVIKFEIDFGIVINPVKHPDLVLTQLCTDEVKFWITASKAKINPSTETTLICDDNLQQTQKILKDLKKKKISFDRTTTSHNLEIIADLIRSGVGVGILPSRVAGRVKNPALKEWKSNLPVFKDKLYLVYRADSQRSMGSKAIIDSIKFSFS